MNKKDIIKQLELDFVNKQKRFDELNDKGSHHLNEEESHELFGLSYELCYIANLLGKIFGTSEDTEMNRLYTKYNLWRVE